MQNCASEELTGTQWRLLRKLNMRELFVFHQRARHFEAQDPKVPLGSYALAV